MSIHFNADEIFQMAEQVERNGAKFYRKAAEGSGDAAGRQFLLELAAMEDEHEKTFASMRAALSPQERTATVFDPQNEAGMYLKVMADGYVFDVRTEPADLLTGQETAAEILRTAIGLEKDSIVFYLGIKEMVPARLGKEKIDHIIKEEMSHITGLSNKLASLS
jgi:rubrerythrin